MNPGIRAASAGAGMVVSGFNEAGAMNPGIHHSYHRLHRRQQHASMRPGL